MPRIQVLIDADGSVLGTANHPTRLGGIDGVPVARVAPRDDQRLVEVELSDAELRLGAVGLMKALATKRLG